MTQDNDPQFMLGVISGKIDLVLVQLANDKAANEVRFAKIEERLDTTDEDVASLKQSRSWVLGGAAAISTAAAGLMALLGLGK